MNMNVSLPEELARFVKEKVDAGRYASSSEIVREALRLLERREQAEAEKLEWLRRAWREGIESGDALEMDADPLKQFVRTRAAARR